MARRLPPLVGRLFSSHALSRVTDTSGSSSTGYVEGLLTLPAGIGAKWVWIVPDAETDASLDVVVSLSVLSTMYVGSMDVSSLGGSTGDARMLDTVTWSEVDLSTSASFVEDHCHVFTAGSHWISYSYGDEVWLLQVDPADARGGTAFTPTNAVLVFASSGSAALHVAADHSTNDHFLVRVPGAVAIGLWKQSDDSLTILVIDTSALTLTSSTSFAGSTLGPVACNTTGSAAQVYDSATGPRTWQVMVPDAITPTTSVNNINLLATDETFASPAAATATLTDTTAAYHYQMPSFLRLDNGGYVLAYKRIPTDGTYDGDGTSVINDWGDVVLAVYDASMATALSEEVAHLAVFDNLANRPHVARWRRYLFTSWDTSDSTDYATYLDVKYLGGYVRVDMLQGVP